MLRKTVLLAVATLSVMLHWGAAQAAKTDTVVLNNGDEITGEVKSLDRGLLSYSTDAMGTISIEWEQVRGVVSTQQLEVVQSSGRRHYGTLAPNSSPSFISVVTDENIVDLPMLDVVRMTTVDSSFREDVDGNLRFGFTGTKANSFRQNSISASVRYRSREHQYSATFDSVLTDSDNDELSRREDLNFGFRRFRENRWYNANNLRFEHNDELNLALRTSLTAGVGRNLLQDNAHVLTLEGGALVAKERLQVPDVTQNNVEGYLTATYSLFRYSPLDVDLTNTLSVYPSVTDSGRVRAEFISNARWELWEDLYWDISLYTSYDSGPEDADQKITDWTLVTGIGWSF